MAYNPSIGGTRRDAQNNGLTHDPKGTNPHKDIPQHRNEFDLTYRHATTERYADITPFMALDVLPGDEIPMKSFDNLRTPTFQAPLEDPLYKRKFFTVVPQRAIMPETWELFYTNPTKGDDVPDDVYPSISLLYWWNHYRLVCLQYIAENNAYMRSAILNRFIVSTELIFSTGSLPTVMKCNLWPYLFKDSSVNLDVFLDLYYNELLSHTFIKVEVQPNQFIYYYCNDHELPEDYEPELLWAGISDHSYLDFIRSGNYELYFRSQDSQVLFFENGIKPFFDSLSSHFDFESVVWNDRDNLTIDISRFAAYQISCISQCSDPAIDYLFNANLWLNYLFPYPATDVSSFTYNGRSILYDRLSRFMLESYFIGDILDGSIVSFCDTICNLLNFNKSLKYGDYFTSARPHVLASGDINIDVNGDTVNALETARKLVYTRFLNWNNRVGPSYEDYSKSLNGVDPAPNIDEPAYINMVQRMVKGYDIENTASEQRENFNITSQVNSSSYDRCFDIFIQEPSILLGMSVYDVPRLYTRGIDKSYFKNDRFDFFNRKLQYTGDQEINAREFNSKEDNRPIAYTTKDMHYKVQTSHASGGFIFALPSWAYTAETDNLDSLVLGINPQFIRNDNGALDPFFSSLTGLSLGTYFHFVCRYINDFSHTTRLMDVAPDIL